MQWLPHCARVFFRWSLVDSSRINSSHVIFSSNFDIPLWMSDASSHSNQTNAPLTAFCCLNRFCLVAFHDLLAASSLVSKTVLEGSASVKSFWRLLTVAIFFSILGIVNLAALHFCHYFFWHIIWVWVGLVFNCGILFVAIPSLIRWWAVSFLSMIYIFL